MKGGDNMDYDVKVNQVMDTLRELMSAIAVDGGDNLEDMMTLAATSYLIGVSVGSGDPTLMEYINDTLEFERLLNE